MSLYVLDTDILVLYQAGNVAVIANVLHTPVSDLATTVIASKSNCRGLVIEDWSQ